MNETGHYSLMSGRLARFLAHQRKRGMSESALARLPKAARLVEPFTLPVVLATRRDAINYENQAAQLAAAKARKRDGNGQFATANAPRAEPPRISWNADPRKEDRTQRAKAILAIVAKHANVEAYQLIHHRGRRFEQPRAIAVYLIRELVGMPLVAVCEIFGYSDPTTPRAAAKRAASHINFDARYRGIHDPALAEIKARWPEYDSK